MICEDQHVKACFKFPGNKLVAVAKGKKEYAGEYSLNNN